MPKTTKRVKDTIRLLNRARRKMGLGKAAKKRVVFEAAATALGVRVPVSKERGYALLEQWLGAAEPVKADARPYVATDAFLSSFEWRQLRMVVIKKRGARCECCGASPQDGTTQINVDHIKPRKTHPELALTESNLQVLCGACNHGKGNWDDTDWRGMPATVN